MPSSSTNIFPVPDKNKFAVTIYSHEEVTKQEILEVLAPLHSKYLGKMVRTIFAMPIKGAGVAHTLKQLIHMSIFVDEELFGKLEEAAEDKLEKMHSTLSLMLDKGQGLAGHDIARLELIIALIGHMIEMSAFDEFRATAWKWLNCIKDNQTKE